MYRVMNPRERHSSMTKQRVLRAALQRVSLRGIERIFGVCCQIVADWIRGQVWQLPVLADTLIDYEI